ncbi:hypothetical protein MTO96_013630 [Rhipicephalus appendiculatus]
MATRQLTLWHGDTSNCGYQEEKCHCRSQQPNQPREPHGERHLDNDDVCPRREMRRRILTRCFIVLRVFRVLPATRTSLALPAVHVLFDPSSVGHSTTCLFAASACGALNHGWGPQQRNQHLRRKPTPLAGGGGGSDGAPVEAPGPSPVVAILKAAAGGARGARRHEYLFAPPPHILLPHPRCLIVFDASLSPA